MALGKHVFFDVDSSIVYSLYSRILSYTVYWSGFIMGLGVACGTFVVIIEVITVHKSASIYV